MGSKIIEISKGFSDENQSRAFSERVFWCATKCDTEKVTPEMQVVIKADKRDGLMTSNGWYASISGNENVRNLTGKNLIDKIRDREREFFSDNPIYSHETASNRVGAHKLTEEIVK